jgi:hypothetical protein
MKRIVQCIDNNEMESDITSRTLQNLTDISVKHERLSNNTLGYISSKGTELLLLFWISQA